MFIRIRTKIIIAYIFFAIIIIGTFGIIASYRVEAIFQDNLQTNLLHEIDLLHYYLSEIPNRSVDSLQKSLNEHAQNSNLRITLIDSSGFVILDTDIDPANLKKLENHSLRPEIFSAEQNGTGRDIRKSRSTQQDYIYVAKKVSFATADVPIRGLKFIRFSVPLTHYKALIDQIRLSIFTASIVVLFLVFFLSLFISKKMTNPIVAMTEELKIIAQGDYSKTITVKSNDEMKYLIDSINQLVDKINNEMKELKKLSMIRSQFLANVSHELRTPLFSIQAFIETLMNGALDDPEVNQKYLQKALNHVERLNNLLNDLIDISRIESKELKLSFRFFAINEFLSKVVENVKFSAQQKEIAVLLELGNDLKVYGDKERLAQVMYNLLDNAIKYNPAGTIIRVYCTAETTGVTIYVSDNGKGIAQEHLPRLFERFYRVEKERSRETGGTGLGLAIVKHIVEAHNSSILVKSELGKGTTFYFKLST